MAADCAALRHAEVCSCLLQALAGVGALRLYVSSSHRKFPQEALVLLARGLSPSHWCHSWKKHSSSIGQYEK